MVCSVSVIAVMAVGSAAAPTGSEVSVSRPALSRKRSDGYGSAPHAWPLPEGAGCQTAIACGAASAGGASAGGAASGVLLPPPPHEAQVRRMTRKRFITYRYHTALDNGPECAQGAWVETVLR